MASNTALGRYFFDRFFSAIELVDFRRLRLLLCDCVDTGIIQITECLNVYLCERFPLPSAGLVLFKYTAANCTAKGTWTNWHLGTSGEQQSIRQPLHDGQCLEVPWASWASWSPWAWQWLLVTSGDFWWLLQDLHLIPRWSFWMLFSSPLCHSDCRTYRWPWISYVN